MGSALVGGSTCGKLGFRTLPLMSLAGAAYCAALGIGEVFAIGFEKSKHEVMSPQTTRRHGVMLGSDTPKRFSMNLIVDV